MKMQVYVRLLLVLTAVILSVGTGLARGVEPEPSLSGVSVNAALPANAAWFIETVDSPDDVGEYTSIAIEPDSGTIYVSYYDTTSKNLKMAKYVGAGGNCGANNAWACETVDSTGDVGKYSSIAINPQTDQPGIAYYDATNGDLKYAAYTCDPTCAWDINTIHSGFSGISNGLYTSLKYHLNGTALVAYYRSVLLGDDSLWLAVSNQGSAGNCGEGDVEDQWQCDLIDSGDRVGKYASLSLGGTNDEPFIAYYDEGDGNLKFAASGTWYLSPNCGPSNSWTCWAVDVAGDVGQFASLSTVPDVANEPHIAYYDKTNEKLKYAIHTGASGNCGLNSSSLKYEWQCETIDDMRSSSTSMGISMGLDASGSPAIAYQSVSSGPDPAAVKIARPASALGLLVGNCGPQSLFYLWQCDVVDGGGSWTDEGNFVALDFNSAGLAAIAYYEDDSYTDGNLKVAYQRLRVFLPLVLKNH